MQPSSSDTVRSHCSERRGSWVTSSTAQPNSRLNLRNSSNTSAADLLSRFPVGSSASSRAGRVTSARATATRCCWPPESWSGRRSSRPARPTSANSPRPRSSWSAVGLPVATISGISTFSSAVKAWMRWWNWNTKPIELRRSAVRPSSSMCRVGLPSRKSSPSLGRSSRPTRLSRVLLPEPEAPTSAAKSWRCRRRSRPCSTSTSVGLPTL